MHRQTREFSDYAAARASVPLNIGLMGPSGGGKTYSMLTLATGIRRVVGGDIFVVDTESNRALMYADKFKFRHVPFTAPFGPLDYLDVLQYCKARGASVIGVDSWSHEHEGPGGLLEIHQSEVERLSGGDARKAERVKMLAWSRPKRERRALIDAFVHLGVHHIGCFRAKEKTRMVKVPYERHDGSTGEKTELVPQGWMPIAGAEFVYEMTVCALLLPGANGCPTWQPEQDGERQMVKYPGFAQGMFGEQITADAGQKLAEWAIGPVALQQRQLLTDIRDAMRERGLSFTADAASFHAEVSRCFGCAPGEMRTLDNERLALGLEKLRTPPTETVEFAVPDIEIDSLVQLFEKVKDQRSFVQADELWRSINNTLTGDQGTRVATASQAARERLGIDTKQ